MFGVGQHHFDAVFRNFWKNNRHLEHHRSLCRGPETVWLYGTGCKGVATVFIFQIVEAHNRDLTIVYCTCYGAAEVTKVHLYWMSYEQVMLLVKEKGYVHFCVWFVHLTMQHPQVIDLIYFANEAWFHSWIHYFKVHIWPFKCPRAMPVGLVYVYGVLFPRP